MPKYRVWFEQINQTYIDVDALDKEQAIRLARADWKFENTLVVTDCKQIKKGYHD